MCQRAVQYQTLLGPPKNVKHYVYWHHYFLPFPFSSIPILPHPCSPPHPPPVHCLSSKEQRTRCQVMANRAQVRARCSFWMFSMCVRAGAQEKNKIVETWGNSFVAWPDSGVFCQSQWYSEGQRMQTQVWRASV